MSANMDRRRPRRPSQTDESWSALLLPSYSSVTSANAGEGAGGPYWVKQ